MYYNYVYCIIKYAKVIVISNIQRLKIHINIIRTYKSIILRYKRYEYLLNHHRCHKTNNWSYDHKQKQTYEPPWMPLWHIQEIRHVKCLQHNKELSTHNHKSIVDFISKYSIGAFLMTNVFFTKWCNYAGEYNEYTDDIYAFY